MRIIGSSRLNLGSFCRASALAAACCVWASAGTALAQSPLPSASPVSPAEGPTAPGQVSTSVGSGESPTAGAAGKSPTAGASGESSTPVSSDEGPTPSATDESGTPTPVTEPFVVGWGMNEHGALGAGYRGWTDGPVSTLASGVRAVAAGMSSYAVLDNGTVEAWGDNTFGQLGNGTHQNTSLPVPVTGITNAVAVATGGAHAMALLSDGTVMTWGGNTFGTLGNATSGKGHEVGEANPGHVPGLSGVVAIAAGGADDVALLSNGTLEAWGENKSGQLGDGTFREKDVPTPVKGLTGVRAVAIGGDTSIGGHMLVLLDNGTVMAVGGNVAGQLGDGATSDSSTPVAVTGLSGVASVSADLTHSMALLENGTVMEWGNNDYGQLGVGPGGESCPTSTCSRVPVAVGLSNVTAISAGFRFSLAVSGGQAFAWGWNQHRELGNGTDLSTTTPSPVIELAGVSAIAAGEFHSLALQTANNPAPALEISPGIGSLTVRWRSGEESQRWIVKWRQAGMHAKWSPLIYLPSTARSYTLVGLGLQPYEVLVRNRGFGTRIISGTPLA